jgi:DMSO/TMAO reductase YedYZ molybdopterin-dependent catalytic subunit
MKLGPVLAGLLVAAPALADVTVDGLVMHPHQWAMSDLKAQPGLVIELSYQTGHGEEKGRFTGVPLWRLLSEVGLADDKGKNPNIRHYIVATGADGYSAVFAVGELDPDLEGKSVLVAYERDGIQTPDLQLVVPGDKKGGRYVHDLVHVEVY